MIPNLHRAPTEAVAYVLETLEDVRLAVAEIEDAGGCTLDLETFGGPFNAGAKILCMALTPFGYEYAYIVPNELLYNSVRVRPILDMLEDGDIAKAGQNLKFDAIWAQAQFGVRMRGVVADTRLWRRLLESSARTSLESMQPLVGMAGDKDEAGQWVEVGKKEINKAVKVFEKTGKVSAIPEVFGELSDAEWVDAVTRTTRGDEVGRYAYAAIPRPTLYRYNAKDVISTDRIRIRFESELAARPQVKRVWVQVMQGMNDAITQMEYNGIQVSRTAIAQLQAMMAGRIAEIETRLGQYPGFEPNSPAQVGELLFNTLGLSPPGGGRAKKTAKGAISVTAEVLEALDHPVAKDVLAYRRATKFKSMYADGMETYISDDGRIHPSINIDGAESGRPSCQGPNLFNIPKSKGDGKLCKDVFVAKPGYVLLEADYSQSELRVAAMLSGDTAMIELFKSGVDFHLQTAKWVAPVLGINPDEVTKEHYLRDRAKTANFASLYQTTPAGLAAQVGCSVKDAEKLLRAILGRFPQLAQWIENQKRSVALNGYVETWWAGEPARVRTVYEIAEQDEETRASAERSAVNTPIQGSAAEFTHASLGALQAWIDKSHVDSKLVLTVYDSIEQEVKESDLAEVAAMTKHIMEQWPNYGVPMVAELKVGYSWGTMEDYKVTR